MEEALIALRGQSDPLPVDPYAALKEHALNNIRRGLIAYDEEGHPATVRSGSVRNKRLNNGQPTLIPFQWDGKILSQREAERRAVESGITWPVFSNEEDAKRVSTAISDSMELYIQ